MTHIDDNLCQISTMMSDRRVNLNGNKMYYALILLAIKDSLRYVPPIKESKRKKHTTTMMLYKNSILDEYRDDARRFLGSDEAEHVWRYFLHGENYHLLRESLQLLWERLDETDSDASKVELGKKLRISLGRMEI